MINKINNGNNNGILHCLPPDCTEVTVHLSHCTYM